MMAVNESKMSKFTVEEILSYGTFDEDGSIIGVEDFATEEFKEAFEADKKMYDEALARGVQL